MSVEKTTRLFGCRYPDCDVAEEIDLAHSGNTFEGSRLNTTEGWGLFYRPEYVTALPYCPAHKDLVCEECGGQSAVVRDAGRYCYRHVPRVWPT